MEGKTIQTLAQYIAQLHKAEQNLEHPEEYAHNETDTNGVTQDHMITVQSSNSK